MTSNKILKPFVKWAGGKGQLLKELNKRYPMHSNLNIKKYVEPFLGGGAVFFNILNDYEFEEIFINDINKELMITYNIIKNNVDILLIILKNIEDTYINFTVEARKEYYLKLRERFNYLKIQNNDSNNIEIAAIFIFLNRTCFNGLYRVNKKGLFNVPMGAYKNPLICDEYNLRNISSKLSNVTIMCGDYKKLMDFIDKNTFVYLDPPYRPLNKTSSFTSYAKSNFNDDSQKELANFINDIDNKKAKFILSNSDPKNTDENDNFFDFLYENFKIERIAATRMINSKSSSRGKINELIISNFNI